jgi:hypothetical protein
MAQIHQGSTRFDCSYQIQAKSNLVVLKAMSLVLSTSTQGLTVAIKYKLKSNRVVLKARVTLP